MKRWLVTGAGGMLGRDLVLALRQGGVEVTALARRDLDITDHAAVTAAVTGHDIVINTAAWTDVDAAETSPGAATEINGRAVAHLAEACQRHQAKLLHLSTDYIFSGTATRPYREQDEPNPVNAYGRSKLAGEQAALACDGYVVRTAWLYGAHGRNFVATILRLATTRETLDVVADQLGQPTWTVSLARQLAALGAAALSGDATPGIYHGTASGETTWHGLARAAFALAGLDPTRVKAVTSAAFPRPAPRPTYSVLAHNTWQQAGIDLQPPWHDQLTAAFTTGVFTNHP